MIPTRVLLVDDEAAFLEPMGKRLKKRGLKVQSALSGFDALDKLEEDDGKTVDVVILDVKMPGMDGIETLRAIKRDHPLLEVVLLTAHGTVEAAIDGMKWGAFDFLMKPSDIDELVDKVEEACRKKRGQERKIMEAQATANAIKLGGSS
jgi:DNA-binding NtrC family response regulator